MKSDEPVMSKSEALKLLSQHLRASQNDPTNYLRLLKPYAELSGWFEHKVKPNKEVSVNEMVRLMEKQQKSQI